MMPSSAKDSAMSHAVRAAPAFRIFRRLSKLSHTEQAPIQNRGAGSPRACDSKDYPFQQAADHCLTLGVELPPELSSGESEDHETSELGDIVMVDIGDGISIILDSPVGAAPRCIHSQSTHGRKHKRTRSMEEDEYSWPAKKRKAFGFRALGHEAVAWIPDAIIRPRIKSGWSQTKSPSAAQGPQALFKFTGNQDQEDRKSNNRLSLTSLPESVNGCSYWLSRPLKKPWTLHHFVPSMSSANSPEDLENPKRRATSVYAACFASGHRSHPSVIRWKSG
ncbi:hypothetical protein HYDPIDRAFT_38520 [Hydnomerulius pinastri MD-312]|nr:hypothetical protein HYDPIDRAFT_38520 [Hydnomerulius pinastri MD-312]